MLWIGALRLSRRHVKKLGVEFRDAVEDSRCRNVRGVSNCLRFDSGGEEFGFAKTRNTLATLEQVLPERISVWRGGEATAQANNSDGAG